MFSPEGNSGLLTPRLVRELRPPWKHTWPLLACGASSSVFCVKNGCLQPCLEMLASSVAVVKGAGSPTPGLLPGELPFLPSTGPCVSGMAGDRGVLP